MRLQLPKDKNSFMKEIQASKNSEGTVQQYLALHISGPQRHAVTGLYLIAACAACSQNR
jgi:hypothetical protein